MADMLPDIIAERLAVVFCGINPGMLAAATGHHFAGRGNRFWQTIHLAGFTPEEILPRDDHAILHYGCGLTAVVGRPTSRADQLSAEEFTLTAAQFEKRSGAMRLVSSVFSARRLMARWSISGILHGALSRPHSGGRRYGFCPIQADEIALSPLTSWSAPIGNFIWRRNLPLPNARETAWLERDALSRTRSSTILAINFMGLG
jgi:hypothetical protein